MKHAIQLIFISACCGLFIGAENAEASRAGIFSFPEIQCSFSQLDARDAQNRSITVNAAMEEMIALFRAGMYDALVSRDAPSLAAAQAVLQTFLKRADAWFLPGARRSVETVAGLAPAARRFVVHLLLPSEHSWRASAGLSRTAQHRLPANLITLPLIFPLMRC